jgi:Flp pilus assembly protein TadD
LLLFATAALILTASAAMPSWIQNIEVRTLLENAIFRTVHLAGGPITIRKPPAETVPAISGLIKTQPHSEQLYSLRALEEEQQLDFASAEADWKTYLQLSSDKVAAQLALADFYHRRLRPLDEISALTALGSLPDSPLDERLAITERPSWQAFERALQVIHAHMVGKAAREATMRQYQGWMAHYPETAEVYARYFDYLIEVSEFKAAESLASTYHGKFPKDEVFPVRAAAVLAFEKVSEEKALAIYDKNFKPLWPKELVKNYFELLNTTHSLGQFLEHARASLRQNPSDLNAVCKVFFYYRQKGNVDAAQQAVTEYRIKKESRKAAWSSQELYTLATLLQDAKAYPEAARYYFALYNSKEMPEAQEKALAGLTNVLLDAPEQQLNFGAGDLSLYSSIATMDSGPGYLNGTLSLILNSTSPQNRYAEEEQRSVPYFHRAQAAQLITLIDERFPASEARSSLHAKLLESYSGYGEYDAVIRLGKEFLAEFPTAGQRDQVGLLMANAYAAKEKIADEFAMYDLLLKELAKKAGDMPLGNKAAGIAPEPRLVIQHHTMHGEDFDQLETESDETADGLNGSTFSGAASSGVTICSTGPGSNCSLSQSPGGALSVHSEQATPSSTANSMQYANVLNLYLSRLAVTHAVPQALAVLRQELYRNPNDPGLYERLAQFLEQNELGTEQEAVYRRAIQQFQGKGWYHKLARWYVRSKRDKELRSLIEEVAQSFSGTELEDYFRQVTMPSDLTIKLNLYSNARFPHNLTFVRYLLDHYYASHNYASWEALIRQHWFEDPTLRSWFFEYLSKTGRLQSELAELKLNPKATLEEWASAAAANPAAVCFAAEAEVWRSHFEDSAAPLGAVAALYPADVTLGREASSVYRSLAWFNSKNTGKAVQVELKLLDAHPQSRDTLARIGDIYADHGQFKLAVPYWNRMATIGPGNPRSYESAATVFWDYYFFHDALRLLNQGRTRLEDNSLYSYEAGAIYEATRDYPKAVAEYVKGAMNEEGQEEDQQEDSPSRKRLLQLATRSLTADLVEAATLKAATHNGFDLKSVQLRAEILEAQLKHKHAEAFLTSVLDHSTSLEVMEGIEHFAEVKSLHHVHRHALERQVALSHDPLRRLQLRYELARFCEEMNDLASAQANIDSIYRQNPRIMGVVRTTVDFYWRNKKQQQAIDVLMQAAKDSHHELALQFTYEAARKMTDARQFEAARELLTALLQQFPYNNEYAAAVADTYLHSGDKAGLRDFYLQRIAFFRAADISGEKRQADIASFRRALIPQLTALKDYAGAVDQYIEVMNAYPDDEDLSTEAALYALRHGRKDQLVNFYRKTVTASPQDSRWIVVLARLQTVNEDFESAIDAFSHAIKIRPDRADLLSARAALEERLLRFDEAASDYTTLYERTYHDPQWMEKVAEIRARQSNPDLAVQALKTAFIENRPEAPGKYFTVAEHLERWGVLPQAREFAERGIAVAGNDLLASPENHSGAETYVRIMTRMRMQEAAWKTLETAANATRQLPPLPRQSDVSEQEWRAVTLQNRVRVGQDGMAKCMKAMGTATSLYFTPEEKQAFLQLVQSKNATSSRQDAYDYLTPLAQTAGFAGLQADLMYESLRTRIDADTFVNELVELQTRRLKLAELGQQLEEMVASCRQCHPEEFLSRAADIYHLAGQPLDELRVLKKMDSRQHWLWSTAQQTRFFELLLKYEPQELLARAQGNDKRGDESADFIVAHADMKMVRAVIKARGSHEEPIWRQAYLGLAGLYFKDTAPEIRSAFLQALSNQTIGQRVRQPGDRSEEMAGDVWFYYGSRYGEYLEVTHQGDPEDWLPAELEHSPGRSSAYFDAAGHYEEIGDMTHAIDDYQHALELAPRRVDVHDHLAEIDWGQGRKDEALEEWHRALSALKNQVSAKITYDLPDSFSDDYSSIAGHLGSHRLLPQFHAQINALLRLYVKHAWSHELPRLLQSSLSDPSNVQDATTLVLELSHEAPDQLDFLGSFAKPKSKLRLNLEPVYRRILELAQQSREKEMTYDSRYILHDWQMKWLEFLLETKRYSQLRVEIDEITKKIKNEHVFFRHKAVPDDDLYEQEHQDNEHDLVKIQLRLAAATNTLDSFLESFNDSENAPSSKLLKVTARELQKAGDRQSARRILEFVFRREVENHNLSAANMLALAEIRLEAGEVQSAVELMRRMTLASGAPFETQEPAAALLMSTGHPQEAIGFLKELVSAAPWNAAYRSSLAQAQIAANVDVSGARKMLAAVASDKAATYEVRASSAKALKLPDSTLDFGSQELKLLASGYGLTVEASNHPFYWAARLQASQNLEPGQRAHLLRLALEDYPHGDSVRPTLLRTAMQAGDYHLAIAGMKPLVKSYWLDMNLRYGYNVFGDPDDIDDEDSDSAAESDTDTPIADPEDDEGDPTPFDKLPTTEKAELTQYVAEAFEKLDELPQALQYFKDAKRLETRIAARKQLEQQISRIREIVDQRKENSSRQPQIHDELEQSNIVRPRLTSGTSVHQKLAHSVAAHSTR